MKMTDIEQLKRQGYKEQEINVVLDVLSKLSISKQEFESLGKNRDDRSVFVTGNDGKTMKSSSIMMGYNKENIKLENGDYVSINDFVKSLENELSLDSNDTVYGCTKTGKIVNLADLKIDLLKESIINSYLNLSSTNAIKNQDAMKISIQNKKNNQEVSKGILMLGNQKLKLPNGDYVLLTDIERAMNDYVKLIPQEEKEKSPSTDNNNSSNYNGIINDKKNSDEKYRVIKRITKKILIIPMLIALLSTLLTGFKLEEKSSTILISSTTQTATVDINSLLEKSQQDIIDEVTKKVRDIKTGDKIDVQEGLEYHSSSDYKYGGKNITGTFGKNNPVGTYNVDYISILHDGKIVHVKYNKDESLGDNLAKVANKFNVSINELESYIHLGGPVSGWVNADDLVKFETQKFIREQSTFLEEGENIHDVENNFNGNTITINDNGENVVIKVTDDNGNIIENGSIVIGSNGQKYRIHDIKIEQDFISTQQNISTGKKLSWSLHNINKEYALASAAVATVLTIASKHEKKDMVTMSKGQIEDLVNETKKKFENSSAFSHAVETITNKKVYTSAEMQLENDLIDKNITVEDIEKLGGNYR